MSRLTVMYQALVAIEAGEDLNTLELRQIAHEALTFVDGEDDKRERSYEPASCVNEQTGAMERAL